MSTITKTPSEQAIEAAKEVESRGLFGAGFIYDESIMGVFIAVLIVAMETWLTS